MSIIPPVNTNPLAINLPSSNTSLAKTNIDTTNTSLVNEAKEFLNAVMPTNLSLSSSKSPSISMQDALKIEKQINDFSLNIELVSKVTQSVAKAADSLIHMQ